MLFLYFITLVAFLFWPSVVACFLYFSIHQCCVTSAGCLC